MEEAETVDVVERIRHIEEKHVKDEIDQLVAKKEEAEGWRLRKEAED